MPRLSPGSTLRVAYAGPTDFDDLPSIIAHDRLRADGQAVEEVAFALSEQSAEAVARGDVAFANGSLRRSGPRAAAAPTSSP
jgi:hypothetical protein